MQSVLRLVVGGEELVGVVDLVDVAPAAAVERLQEGGEARRTRTRPSQSSGYCRLRIDRSVVPVGCSLCGSSTVGGMATPSLVASA